MLADGLVATAAGVTAAALEDMVVFCLIHYSNGDNEWQESVLWCGGSVCWKKGDRAANPKHRKKKDPDYCRDYL